MASLIAASTQLTFPAKALPRFHTLPIPSSLFVVLPPEWKTTQKFSCLKLKLQVQHAVVNYHVFLIGSSRFDGVLRRCAKEEGVEDEIDGDLDAEVVEFMNKSNKPHMFPTKKELIHAGRMDLVEAILKRGGWMILGWDVDDDKEKMELVDWRSKLDGYSRLSSKGNSVSLHSDVGSLEASFLPASRSSPDAYKDDQSLWETKEGDSGLVTEIIGFMKNSKNPYRFPSKKELIEAGRRDLADAIVMRGGWMTLVWDEDYEREASAEVVVDSGANMPPEHILPSEERGGLLGKEVQSSPSLGDSPIAGITERSYTAAGSSSATSSSDRSLVVAAEETGIEGILNRLEKQRNSDFGLNLMNNNDASLSYRHANKGHLGRLSSYVGSQHSERSQQAASVSPWKKSNDADESSSHIDGLRNSPKPDTWRTWSIQRAGFADREFEAGEINFEESKKRRLLESSANEIIAATKDSSEPLKDLNSCDKIRTRLQHLEAELSSALHLLRSNHDDLRQKDQQKSSDSEEVNTFSDAWEFQENEIMQAKDRLRSIRANVAVVEGKMALAINDAQRAVDEKQRRINEARIALQLLRTTYIVWPTSASEVLLSGSFDGWSTQRKMERSITGVFSLSLKLYPGKYEIKFIVDGVWKVDPLRPVVWSDGYENNLLIVE